MMENSTCQSLKLSDEELIYEYHRMKMPVEPMEAVFCLCSLDVRVASYAASLFLSLNSQWLIFSGGSGKVTSSIFNRPEAEIFAEKAKEMGVPEDRIIMESQSSNTGENVRFTWELLQQRKLSFESMLLIQKPYMERRTYATFKKQWPDEKTKISVSSPPLKWNGYLDDGNPRDIVVGLMVGDLVRMRVYATRGFQIPMDVPKEIWEAGERLIKKGYGTHLP
jgi:hypothetical protein